MKILKIEGEKVGGMQKREVIEVDGLPLASSMMDVVVELDSDKQNASRERERENGEVNKKEEEW